MQGPPMSPAAPVAPPMKKQRAGGTPIGAPPILHSSSISNSNNNRQADDSIDNAISRRRAQIKELQQQRDQQNAVLNRARIQLQAPGAISRSTPGIPPPGTAVARVRNSDIFPSVPKAKLDLNNIKQQLATQAPPTRTTLPTGTSPSSSSSSASSLARRLDASFSSSKATATASKATSATATRAPVPPVSTVPPPPSRSRSKSAPPSRPPPPPPKRDTTAPKMVDTSAVPSKIVSFGSGLSTTTTTPKIPPTAVTKAPPSAGPSRDFRSRSAPTAPPEVTSPPPNEQPSESTSVTPGPTAKLDAGSTPFPIRTLPVDDDKEDDENQGTTLQAKTLQPITSSNMGILSPNPLASLTMPSASNKGIDGSSIIMSPELRMQKEMSRLEREKARALTKVAELETMVKKLQEASSTVSPVATTKIASKQVGFGFLPHASPLQGNRSSSNLSNISSPPISGTPLSPPAAKRAPTPYPKRSKPKTALAPEEERAMLEQAADSTAHEYVSQIATFTVRKPFGRATEQELWYSAGQLNNKSYEKNADPFKAPTLEVVAKIHADDTVFCLYGDSFVRHQPAPDAKWKEYGDAEENQPLGTISYIDSDANEKYYSLDEIYQGALAVREHYCSSFCSVVSHVQSHWKKEATATKPPLLPVVPGVTAAPRKAVTKDTGVGTDTPFPAMQSKAASESPAPSEETAKKPKKKSAEPTPPDTGAMTTFISMFINGIFGLIWYIFVRIPLRIVSTTIVLLGAALVLSTIWMYIADDHGAADMGAIIHTEYYNPPGIA